MRRLGGELARLAALAAAVALSVMLLLNWLAFSAISLYQESRLPPNLREELHAEQEPMSAELLTALERIDAQLYVDWITAGSLALGVMAGGAVGFWRARRLAQPLVELAAVARQLRAGLSGARGRTGTTKVQEIEDFIADFNAMADSAEAAERERRLSNAAIAHELRTPLTVLNGRLCGMADGLFALDQTAVQGLLTQTSLLTRIVDDLRLLTLAQAGQLALSCEDCDLARVAADVAKVLQPLLAEQGQALELELRPATVRADPGRIQQALQALLHNAQRYTGGEPLRIVSGVQGEQAYLQVLDRGPGLSVAQADQAFERFWRGESSRGRETGGSGLGLSVVRAIAQAHGGLARYSDRPGGGACFEIRLPLAQPESVAARR
ncbi:MAG TPA: two-component sensor histidine kinase [Candidatus Competibacteraceae bacterium]|nr:two-component sensor histidine kinase [Candidatus Competibacteraceae bacterium]